MKVAWPGTETFKILTNQTLAHQNNDDLTN